MHYFVSSYVTHELHSSTRRLETNKSDSKYCLLIQRITNTKARAIVRTLICFFEP